MPTPFWTRLVIGLAAVLWLGLALVLDAPVDATWLKPAGVVVAAVVILLLAFDRWAWKLLPVAVTKRPNLRGTWKAVLEYQWPEDTPTQIKPCYLTINQTYSTVSIDMHFDISDSESRSAAIVANNGKRSLVELLECRQDTAPRGQSAAQGCRRTHYLDEALGTP